MRPPDRSAWQAVRFAVPLLALSLTACGSDDGRDGFFDPVRQRAALTTTSQDSPYGSRPVREPAEETPRVQPFAVRGSGAFVNTGYQPPASRVQIAQAGPGEFTLNFADADLREVIRAMLQDSLETNYTVDPRVQGMVTLQTSRPLSRAQILPTLEEILRLNGAALIEGDGIFRIVPIEEAGRSAPNLSFNDLRGRGLSVRVVPLRFVSAPEIEGLLESFGSVAGGLRVDAGRNLLFLTGTRQELNSLANMVSVLDVDWMKGMSFALQPLRVTAPDTMISELEQIFEDPSGPKLAGLLRFVPIERMNAVLVISKQPRYLDEALQWIARLDQGGGDQQRVHVYYVQNRRAADLAEVLGQIFGIETASFGDSTADLAPGLTPITLSTGEAPGGEALDAPPPAPLDGGPSASGGSASLAGLGEVRIIADEESNSLVTLASSADYDVVEAALKKLDILPLQVLIEATIAEVTLTEDLEFGVRYFFQQGNNEFTFSDLAGGAVGAVFPGFSYVFSSSDAQVALNVLQGVTDIEVLSAPSLVVLDNQTGKLEVGDQVPVATRSTVSTTDPDAPAVNEVEQRDTGVILTVTPRVNAGGLVILEIVQEVSDAVATETSDIDSPTIRKRKLDSTIAIQSGETVALGGLITNRREEAEVGIPLLSDIPLLGNLFKTTDDQDRRSELLVLIRPVVIRDSNDARAVTDELRRKMKVIFPEFDESSSDAEEADEEEGGPSGS